ncbi:MAG: diaminopimelate epimerase [Cardiobacteriaceae bacterium]|nr:diaminopimelate epimerase [Cardiobacteriaceae bacterium]
MQLDFQKMHGLGNDFAVFDCRNRSFEFTSDQIKCLSDRNLGIGFDQMLVIENPPNDNVDFLYRIFNADGGEVEHCGNGARCFAKYLRDKGIFNFQRPVRVAIKKGYIEIDYVGKDANGEDIFRVDMGQVDFSPFTHKQSSALEERIDCGVFGIFSFGILSIGNPHAVCVVEDIKTAPVKEIGSFLQNHPLFPEKVNVGFMQLCGRDRIKLRVFERGCGETKACGTGACAATAVGIGRGILDRCVTVELAGGNVMVEWNGTEFAKITMNGRASTVYSGKIDESSLQTTSK